MGARESRRGAGAPASEHNHRRWRPPPSRVALPPIADAQSEMILDGLKAMDAKDRAEAEARARRAREKAAAAQPQGAVPPDVARAQEIQADDPEALALFLPPQGTAGGPATPCQAVPPPSPNGGSHRGRPGG
jgi:hypothetical protein